MGLCWPFGVMVTAPAEDMAGEEIVDRVQDRVDGYTPAQVDQWLKSRGIMYTVEDGYGNLVEWPEDNDVMVMITKRVEA